MFRVVGNEGWRIGKKGWVRGMGLRLCDENDECNGNFIEQAHYFVVFLKTNNNVIATFFCSI